MSLRLSILNVFLRLLEKPYLARTSDPSALRYGFEAKARFWFRAPRGSRFHDAPLGGVPAHRVATPGSRGDAVILYFHGGGYVFGSPRTHRAMLARLSLASGVPAILPDYRLAPEHPFPAAFDDALASYRGLLDDGIAPGRIILGGDSAGGGLVLALLAEICRRDLPKPAGVFAFSPVTDLSFSGSSIDTNARAEVMLPASRAHDMAATYLNGADPRDPRASPLFADFTGAPPVWLTVGDSEILIDDAQRLAAELQRQGIETTLEIRENLPHVWPIFQGLLPEADQTLQRVAEWIRPLMPPPADS